MNLIDEFIQRSGHPPRILHIGNIANNAYLNSKILNKAGFESDVCCGEDYYIMASPEWEDADFNGNWGDDNNPDWLAAGVPTSFRRPEWFAQSSFKNCCAKLLLRRQSRLKNKNVAAGDTVQETSEPESQNVPAIEKYKTLLKKLKLVRLLIILKKSITTSLYKKPLFFKSHEGFSLCYQDRIRHLLGISGPLFNYYDIVIGYSTEGELPLVAGKRPYCAYEHGTIRNIPFENTDQGRMCALTYQQADHCFITNCDNILAANKLGLQKYSFVPHPVNEDIMVDEGSTELRRQLHEELNSDFIVFHPPRQHWEAQRHPDWEKGNDFLIYGLAKFIKEVNPRGAAIFVEWGQKVNESKELLASLGIASRVKWVKPLPNIHMIKYIKATDLLADQFYLGAFGSTMPKALLHGSPAMIYLDEDRHRWCFPEMPPVLNVQRPDDICAALKTVYQDKDFREKLILDGKAWYDKYHSNRVIAERFSNVFNNILKNN